ncbi:serine/arginine-rich SC35-like splicing factor SCL33 [Raphanus sativus]|uniref:Serine/arginine-rich SC35-like splicing factor SCL33 n=1 Tax=Raphanus sativus TaxID=3726 RepID=A0A9W3CS65_RAPSA|nr:serine/arginine-rich SC35-like splicing factor SCL33 [Raphanus sativus]
MRGRSKSPRGNRYTTLLVRNLSHDCREKDLRSSFEQFGPLKDVYLPRDYNTGDPRGFGFIEFEDRDDAAEAKDQMDGNLLLGRELSVMFGEANRKKPTEMRARQRSDGSIRFRDRRRSSPRYYPRSPPRSSRSPPPYIRRHSRSISPRKEGYDRRRRSYSRSPANNGSRGRSASPVTRKSRRRSINRSPSKRSISQSPRRNRSPSPRRIRSNTPLPASRSRSRSPRRRSNTPLPARRNRSLSPRRRRSNTPVPPASSRRTSSRRSQSPRRRSNTPLPARSRSPRGDSPSQ